MKREDIDNAAREESGRWSPNPIHLQDIYRRDDFEAGFHTGADWRINSVWHDVSEKPQKNDVHIAVLNKYGIKTDFWCDFCGWEKYVRLDKIEKWAYIEDLIPNTED